MEILDAHEHNADSPIRALMDEIRQELVNGLWPLPFSYVIHTQEGVLKRAFHQKRKEALKSEKA